MFEDGKDVAVTAIYKNIHLEGIKFKRSLIDYFKSTDLVILSHNNQRNLQASRNNENVKAAQSILFCFIEWMLNSNFEIF